MKIIIAIICITFLLSFKLLARGEDLYKLSEIDTKVHIFYSNETAKKKCMLDTSLLLREVDSKINKTKIKINKDSPTKLSLDFLIFGLETEDSFLGCVANLQLILWENIYADVSYRKNLQNRFIIYELGISSARSNSEALYEASMDDIDALIDQFIKDWEYLN